MSQGIQVPGLAPRIPSSTRHTTGWQPPNWVALSVWSMFVLLWVGLGVMYIFAPDAVDQVWAWVGDQPTFVQIGIWVAFLPVAIAVAVLETEWALWVRLGVLALCVIWTTVGLRPAPMRQALRFRR